MTISKNSIAFNPKLFLSKIGSGRTNEKFSARDLIFSQGDPASAVYYLQKGKVKITVTSEAGKETVLAITEADNFLARVA